MNLIDRAENALAGRCVYCCVEAAEVHKPECVVTLQDRIAYLEGRLYTLNDSLNQMLVFMNQFKSMSYDFKELEELHRRSCVVFGKLSNLP
jgi:hypothetical protein